MKFRSLCLLSVALLLPTFVSAQEVLEEHILVKNLPPSVILDRVNILAGLPPEAGRAFQVTADDATKTINVSVPASYKNQMERERIGVILHDLIDRVDQPEPQMAIDIYVVQTNLLNDEEFMTLDKTLKDRALALERGVTAKGVVTYQQIIAANAQIVDIDQTMREARAQTRPEPARLSGKFLAVAKKNNITYLSSDLSIDPMDRPIAAGQDKIRVGGKAETNSARPIIYFAGELNRVTDNKHETFPARHEVMVYVWVTQQ